MKDEKTRDEFVQLRARGWAYFQIGAHLKLSEATMMRWMRKYSDRIDCLKAIRNEAEVAALVENEANQCKTQARLLHDLDPELGKRDLSTLSTGALIRLKLSVYNDLLKKINPQTRSFRPPPASRFSAPGFGLNHDFDPSDTGNFDS